MNVGHVKGHGGIEPTPNRSEQSKTKESGQASRSPETGDQAQISAASRDTLAAVDALSQKARASEDRIAKVDAARERLESGALDQPEVYEAAARALLDDREPPAEY